MLHPIQYDTIRYDTIQYYILVIILIYFGIVIY